MNQDLVFSIQSYYESEHGRIICIRTKIKDLLSTWFFILKSNFTALHTLRSHIKVYSYQMFHAQVKVTSLSARLLIFSVWQELLVTLSWQHTQWCNSRLLIQRFPECSTALSFAILDDGDITTVCVFHYHCVQNHVELDMLMLCFCNNPPSTFLNLNVAVFITNQWKSPIWNGSYASFL